MANNLKKFNTQAEYENATLNYPAVSWVTGTDVVYFDAEEPVTNDKIMIGFYSQDAENTIILYNGEASDTDFTSITLNDVAVYPIVPELQGATEADTDYVVKYGSNYTIVTDAFSGDLGIGGASNVPSIEMYLPSTITEIDFFPNNQITALVVDSTTPPSSIGTWSDLNPNLTAVYVPDEAVNAYKSDGFWGSIEDNIYPISEYQGNLPI